jgi:GDP/UDP-N,N'-diacetylbacillosamine 2-epimerase (hydrolysing)
LPTILSTFHPETVDPQKNQDYAKVLFDTFKELSQKYQIVITLPNADTEGVILRDTFLKLPKQTNNRVICVENLGTLGYFSCMKHCKMLLGNTSSGIIEAASFKRWVIDLGDRQKGRACSENVVHCEIEKKKIISAIKNIEDKGDYMGENIYYQGGAVRNIMSVLKRIS